MYDGGCLRASQFACGAAKLAKSSSLTIFESKEGGCTLVSLGVDGQNSDLKNVEVLCIILTWP